MIDMQKLADLARISIPTDERQSLAHDLEAIIGFVDQIRSVTPPKREQVPDRVNVLRPDDVVVVETAYDLVLAAPEHQDGFVKVPKVIE